MLGVSISRNEKLANVFYRLALIEAYGTGVPKIIKSYEDVSAKPKFETSDNAFKITLFNKNAEKGTKGPGPSCQTLAQPLAAIALPVSLNKLHRLAYILLRLGANLPFDGQVALVADFV